VTVASPDDGQELEEYPTPGPEGIELLELADLEEPQELGPGLTVDATVAKPAPKRKRDTNILPPRRWPRVGARELRSCPRCHTVVASVKEGFWHEQAQHGGQTPSDIDMDEWGEDLQQEVAEYREAIKAGRARAWRGSAADRGLSGSHMAAALLAVIVVMVVTGIIYALTHL
jgi:hypothetical protein